MLPVVWGKRTVRTRLGYSADFCPICRTISCVAVTRMGVASHLYFIPLGRGTPTAHEVRCDECDTPFTVREFPAAFFLNRPPSDPIGLLSQSRPDRLDPLLERMEFEERAARLETDADERARLIAEPFLSLEPWVRAKAAAGNIPTLAGFAIILGLVAVIVAAGLWASPRSPLGAKVGVSVAAAVLLLLSIRAAFRGNTSWARREIHPRLARSLAPLRPRPEEIADVLAQLGRQGHTIARRVNQSRLIEDVCGPPAA